MKRKIKYNSRRSKCINGHWHHSKGESGYCNKLEMLKNVGHIKDFKTQHKIDIIVSDVNTIMLIF